MSTVSMPLELWLPGPACRRVAGDLQCTNSARAVAGNGHCGIDTCILGVL